MATTRYSAYGLAVLLLASCGPAAERGVPLGRLGDKWVLGEPRAGNLFLAIHEAPQPKAGYHALFVRELDWERAAAQLTNTDGTVPVSNQTVNATLDATNHRKALLSFTPVKPAAGYTLAITLQRRDASGVYRTIASGSNAGFTINPGANAISVSLTATAQGELLIDLSKPSLVLNGLTSNVATQSSFSVRRLAGDATGGNLLGTSPLTAAFKEVSGLEVDGSGVVYVADAGNHQVRSIPTSGGSVVLAGTVAGTSGFGGDEGPATASQLNTPRGLTRDPSTGNIFFCDSGNNRVRAISNANGAIYTIAGGGTNTANAVAYAINAQLSQPFGIAADQSGNVFLTERGTGRVLRVDTTGALTTLATLTPNGIGPIAVDRTNGLVWVGDGANVRVITGATSGAPALVPGAVLTTTGASTPYITGLAFDQIGTLFAAQAGDSGLQGVTDAKIWRVPVTSGGALQPGRAAEVVAGTGGTSGASASFSVPTAAVANALGQLVAGKNWCGLYVDMSAGLSGTTLSGLLYSGNSYDGAWGQVLQLAPAAL